MHAGWQMRESAIAGDDGPGFSRAGFNAAGWYSTTVPATPLGVLIRHGVYPDPYIGINNMRIPDASDEHNRRYKLSRFSHLPERANPWTKPYWFRREFRLPEAYRGRTVWLHLDGINYRADVWLNGRQVADAKSVVGMFRALPLRRLVAAFPGRPERRWPCASIRKTSPATRSASSLPGCRAGFAPAAATARSSAT